MNRTVMLALVGALASCGAPQKPQPSAKGAPPVPRDLATREQIIDYAATFGYSLGLPKDITVTPSGDAVLFLRSGPRSLTHDLYAVDTSTGKERVLLRAGDLLDQDTAVLSAEEKARRERQRTISRGITEYELSRDGTRILVPLSGKLFVVERETGAVKKLAVKDGYPLAPRLSPDGKSIATAVDDNVQIVDVASGKSRPLTNCRGKAVSCGTAEFVAQEEMRRYHGLWWSPDSRFVAFQKTDEADVELLYLASPRFPEKPPRAHRYPRAGTDNAVVTLGIVAREGGKPVWAKWDRQRYPYLADVVWQPNAPLTIVVQNRTQTEVVLLAVDHETGETQQLLRETDDAWVNLHAVNSAGISGRGIDESWLNMPHWLADGSGFLWVTERRGATQLELHDKTGALVRTLTDLQLGFRGVLSVDEKAGTALVIAASDPAQRHIYRLALAADGPAPQKLTTEPGLHTRTVARDHSVYVQTDLGERALSPTYTVRRKDGTEVTTLRKVAEAPPYKPHLVRTQVESGGHRFDVLMVRPRNFSAAASYPVLVHVYGGPAHKQVAAAAANYLQDQWFADHGFVVVNIDGRGTPNRGRAWERATKGDFVRIPLADQKAALEALSALYPHLDLSRVGIYGWSFGGTMAAAAVMLMPETFHAGFAGAPVTDWHDYDTHYTERYLGLPAESPEAYRVSSPVTYADKLSRPLLLMHGTVDDNVLFLHALELSDALFRAGKPHQFLPLSGFTHMVPDPEVSYLRAATIVRFFEQHLGDPRPDGGAENLIDERGDL